MLFRSRKVLPLPPSSYPQKRSPTSTQATILELNLISAQDLVVSSNKSQSMTTYAVVYIDPEEKLSSRTAKGGGVNPTWNDKMIFALDTEELESRPNLCMVIHVYRARRLLKDQRIGCLHLRLHDLLQQDSTGAGKCMALLLRNDSGEPRGILNIGLVGLDSIFHRHRPGFLLSRSAVDHKTLGGAKC